MKYKNPKSEALAARFPKPAKTVGSGLRDNNVRHPVTGAFVKTQKAQVNYTNQGEQVINKKGPTWS